MIIFIKGEQSEKLEINIQKRLRPDNLDYWDGNFLSTSIKATAHGFNASFICHLRTDELNEWFKSVEIFLQNSLALISFKTTEENISIEGSGDVLGNVIWKCILKGSEERPSVLTFSIHSSIEGVEILRDELKEAIAQYPIVGAPY